MQRNRAPKIGALLLTAGVVSATVAAPTEAQEAPEPVTREVHEVISVEGGGVIEITGTTTLVPAPGVSSSEFAAATDSTDPHNRLCWPIGQENHAFKIRYTESWGSWRSYWFEHELHFIDDCYSIVNVPLGIVRNETDRGWHAVGGMIPGSASFSPYRSSKARDTGHGYAVQGMYTVKRGQAFHNDGDPLEMPGGQKVHLKISVDADDAFCWTRLRERYGANSIEHDPSLWDYVETTTASGCQYV